MSLDICIIVTGCLHVTSLTIAMVQSHVDEWNINTQCTHNMVHVLARYHVHDSTTKTPRTYNVGSLQNKDKTSILQHYDTVVLRNESHHERSYHRLPKTFAVMSFHTKQRESWMPLLYQQSIYKYYFYSAPLPPRR